MARTSKSLSAATLALTAGVLLAPPNLAPSALAQNAASPVPPRTSLTIYSSAQPGAIDPSIYRPVRGIQYYGNRPEIPGSAMVREQRFFDLSGGTSTVKFTDVAAMIDPTTVSFKSITDPEGTSVLEQNFQFDLVSPDKLLERFIDKPINVTVVRGDKPQLVQGTLLSSSPSGFVLRTEGNAIEVINGYSGISLPEAGDALVTRPTLQWLVGAKKPGKHDVRLSYETEGITWWTDYNLVYSDGKDANHGSLDASAWVSILNMSGASYKDAQLKLIAGEVNRAPKQQQMMKYDRRAVMEMSGNVEGGGFQEKSFFEYHLYTLGRATTLPDNSTKQVELFPTARNVPCEKILVYDALASNSFYDYGTPMTDQSFGVQSIKDVNIFLKFKNDQASRLGVPLPAGRIRVSKLDPADGSLEFIGEDVLRHTPRDEEVLVKLGKAFDVVGERRQVDFTIATGRNEITETIEIKVRNRKQESTNVIVQERMYRWANWEFVGPTPELKKLDARTIHFPLTLKPGEEGVVKYKVRYTW
jgi:hypothetical protein